MSAAISAPPGYFVSTTGATILKPAPIGSFSPTTGAAAATTDPVGTYTPVKGMQATILAGDLDADGLVSQAELNVALTNYWANNPWLMMTNVAGLGGTNVTFALTNSIEGNYSVQWSTNLTVWNYLGSAAPRYQFADTNATTFLQRFYRLRWP